MQIDDLVARLQAIACEHGNVDVMLEMSCDVDELRSVQAPTPYTKVVTLSDDPGGA